MVTVTLLDSLEPKFGDLRQSMNLSGNSNIPATVYFNLICPFYYSPVPRCSRQWTKTTK